MNAHSALGASGAERWLECPGSNGLLKALSLPQSDESEYAKEGTAAHAVAAFCLQNGLEAWEVVGDFHEDHEVTTEMAEAIQVFLNVATAQQESADTFLIEQRIARPDLHPLYFGTADIAAYFAKLKTLEVTDYKHGAGIAVDVQKNPQLMYYAFGLLDQFPDCEFVIMRIVQPRCFHVDGKVRDWMITTAELREWAETVLLPGFRTAENSNELLPGSWCRFCPAKLACPVLYGLFRAAATCNPQAIPKLTDEALGRDYALREAVQHYLKAQDQEVFRRLNCGTTIEQAKLVYKQGRRVFKEGAEEVLAATLRAEDIYEKPELKSPAQIEKLSSAAKKLVTEWAYTPDTGLTVAPITDRRPAIKVQSVTEKFASVLVQPAEAE